MVEHCDCLLRFGAEYVEAALSAQGRKLIVVQSTEVKDDLVQDMIEVPTSCCATYRGASLPATRQQKALQAIGQYQRPFSARSKDQQMISSPMISSLLVANQNVCFL